VLITKPLLQRSAQGGVLCGQQRGRVVQGLWKTAPQSRREFFFRAERGGGFRRSGWLKVLKLVLLEAGSSDKTTSSGCAASCAAAVSNFPSRQITWTVCGIPENRR